jgi:putative phosphoribosyl transferase
MTYRERSREIVFRDRSDAGRQLAERLADERLAGDVVVLGLPRGGVPVAFEIATQMQWPLDVLIVRKLGAPFHRELAVGAIASGGVIVYNDGVLRQLGLSRDDVEPTRLEEQAELERRETKYRSGRAPLDVAGKVVVLVDDGIATGATMLAAVEALRALEAARIVVAVPTSSESAYLSLRKAADDVIALSTPEPYVAVGAWYRSFAQTGDQEVIDLLAQCAGGSEAQR